MKIYLLIFAIILSCNRNSDKIKSIPLDGKWIDYDNEKSILVFADSIFYYIYNFDTASHGIFRRQSYSCNNSYADTLLKSDFLIFHTNDKEFCYEITSLSDSVLVYRNTISGTLYKYYKEGCLKPTLGPD